MAWIPASAGALPRPTGLVLACGLVLLALPMSCGAVETGTSTTWWTWLLALFLGCFLLGMIAVPAGVGGGVLFVPVVAGLFPFHIDFVRGTGVLIALASSLSAAPSLLRAGLADLRLALPLAVAGSIGSIAGALIGLALPPRLIQLAMGATILVVAAVTAAARRADVPAMVRQDRWSAALGWQGRFFDHASSQSIAWQARRAPVAMLLFAGIGLIAGMFGMGAGWANVPVLNLLMGVPLKVAAGTSGLVLTLVSASASWVYLQKGAVLAAIAVPSVVGMMLGARIGARLLDVLPARAVRGLVILLLVLAGTRNIARGLGFWS